jgi:hypothetical protein
MKPYKISENTNPDLMTPTALYNDCLEFLSGKGSYTTIDYACGQVEYLAGVQNTDRKCPDIYHDASGYYTTCGQVDLYDSERYSVFCNPPGGSGSAARIKYQLLDEVVSFQLPTLWLIYNINSLPNTLRRITVPYQVLIFDERLKWEPKQSNGSFFGSAMVYLLPPDGFPLSFSQEFGKYGTILCQ